MTMSFPTATELAQYRQALISDPEALRAIDLIEQTQDFETAINQLFQAQAGTPQMFGKDHFGDSMFNGPGRKGGLPQVVAHARPNIWQLFKKRIQAEVCGEDDSIRSMIQALKKNPGNAALVTGAITYVINLSGIPFPIEPALATGIVLYIAHIGIDVFCEWSQPQVN